MFGLIVSQKRARESSNGSCSSNAVCFQIFLASGISTGVSGKSCCSGSDFKSRFALQSPSIPTLLRGSLFLSKSQHSS